MPAEKSPSAPITPERSSPRFPPAVRGIQVNHCRSPCCDNFGVPPHETVRRGRRPKDEPEERPGPGDYVVSVKREQPYLVCSLCNEEFPMQSNLAIVEELDRMSAYLDPVLPACQNSECEFFQNSAEEAQVNYTRYGVNKHGTPRFKCRTCSKIFAFGGKSTKGQHDTHLNRDIFRHLVNTVPIRRILKLLDISPSVLYSRIDFIHRQCQLFAAERERTLLQRRKMFSRYVSVDRQKLIVNWSSKKRRRNTILLSIATADQRSGYVYGAHLNFDESLDENHIAVDHVKYGDQKLALCHRRYARVWLEKDYEAAAARNDLNKRKKAEADGTGPPVPKRKLGRPRKARPAAPATPDEADLVKQIEACYDATLEREAIEDGDEPSLNSKTPAKGVLLHEQTVMFAHLQFVSRLLVRAGKLRFYMDQESGLRAAFMATLSRRIRARTADAFFVKVAKKMTIDQKRKIVAQSKKDFAAASARYEGTDLTDEDIQVDIIRRTLSSMREIGEWDDKWLTHPVSDMREPLKMASWLTDIDDPITTTKSARKNQLTHHAKLYFRASLTGVDRFFMQLRRALTMAERGVVSSSSDGRVWFGKNAYNPAVLAKLIEIYRTYFNYCEVGGNGKTPAMRMRLARGPVREEDILAFVPPLPARRRAPPAT